jgi:hypothetical protein
LSKQPFKAYLQKKWVSFMVNENTTISKDNSRQMIAQWVVDSFDEIKQDSITKK